MATAWPSLPPSDRASAPARVHEHSHDLVHELLRENSYRYVRVPSSRHDNRHPRASMHSSIPA